MLTLRLAVLIVLAVSGCATAPELPPVQPYGAAALAKVRYKAVLVAGDGCLPVRQRGRWRRHSATRT